MISRRVLSSLNKFVQAIAPEVKLAKPSNNPFSSWVSNSVFTPKPKNNILLPNLRFEGVKSVNGSNLALGRTIFQQPAFLQATKSNSLSKLVVALGRQRGLAVALGLIGVAYEFSNRNIIDCEPMVEVSEPINVGLPKTIFSQKKNYSGFSEMMGTLNKGEKLELCDLCDDKENHYKTHKCHSDLVQRNTDLRYQIQKAKFEISLLKTEKRRIVSTLDNSEKENKTLLKEIRYMDRLLQNEREKLGETTHELQTQKDNMKLVTQDAYHLRNELEQTKIQKVELQTLYEKSDNKLRELNEEFERMKEEKFESDIMIGELKARLVGDNRFNECIICCDREIEIVYGCGHYVTCKECDESVHASNNHCPICRREVLTRIKAFKI